MNGASVKNGAKRKEATAMPMRGFTLPECLTTLVVAAILAAGALPAFSRLVQSSRLEGATERMISAIHSARSHAVRANHRVTLAAAPQWEDGWMLFVDTDHDGEHDSQETLLAKAEPLNPAIEVSGNTPVEDYISYLGTGESRWATGDARGGFQAGTITLCAKKGKGVELVLSRGGRLREHPIEHSECPAE